MERGQRGERRASTCVIKGEVTLAERAADRVLATQSDGHASGHQTGEGERLGVRPVDWRIRPVKRGSATLLERPVELRMDREALRKREQRSVELTQPIPRDPVIL